MTSMALFLPNSISFLSLSCRLKVIFATGRPKRSFSSASCTRLSACGRISPSKPKRCPMVVVHHHAAQAPAPRAFRDRHLLGERDRQRPDGLDREATCEVALRIGFVEFFGQRMRGRRLVHANEFVEAAERSRCRPAPSDSARPCRWNSRARFRSPGHAEFSSRRGVSIA